jgi:transcriptional regulator with XRE-family HTH domain
MFSQIESLFFWHFNERWEDNPGMIIAKRIKETRRAKGWNQTRLAREAGMAQGTLSLIESGHTKRPRGDMLIALAEALGVPAPYLMGKKTRSSSVSREEEALYLLQKLESRSTRSVDTWFAVAREMLGPGIPIGDKSTYREPYFDAELPKGASAGAQDDTEQRPLPARKKASAI